MKTPVITVAEATSKAEIYCAYQDRCHSEVFQKLRGLGMTKDSINHILVHLINHDYLNEERFARNFSRGKHRTQGWGISRIEQELKIRGISPTNIRIGLSEIQEDEYDNLLSNMAERRWNATQESNILKKKKKVFDYLIRKGYDLNLVYRKIDELSSSE